MQMQPDKFKTMGDALRDTMSKHGAAGLYKGVGAPLVGNGFYNAVQFAIFANAKRWFTSNGALLEPWRVAAAGGFTGVFVALVEGPQDLVKSQLQAQMMTKASSLGGAGVGAAGAAGAAAAAAPPPRFAGVGDCARAIAREQGLRGLTQGLSATVARNVIGVSAYFYFYELVRSRLAGPSRRVTELSAMEVMFAGGCGGCVGRTSARGCAASQRRRPECTPHRQWYWREAGSQGNRAR